MSKCIKPWVFVGAILIAGCGDLETQTEANRRAARCAELGGQPVTLSDSWRTTICSKIEPIDLDEPKP